MSDLKDNRPIRTAIEAATAFTAKQINDTEELLDTLFEINPTASGPATQNTDSAAVRFALKRVDQITLCKYLQRTDCPEWLAIWAAKNGTKEHQISYLLRPGLSDEISIADRIGSRPQSIRVLLQRSKAPRVLTCLMEFDDETYLTWARDIGFDEEVAAPKFTARDREEDAGSARALIDEWIRNALDPIVDALWREHVPEQGACTVLQGELARCIKRLEGEYWKNGMMNIGDGYYDRMVNKITETISTNK